FRRPGGVSGAPRGGLPRLLGAHAAAALGAAERAGRDDLRPLRFRRAGELSAARLAAIPLAAGLRYAAARRRQAAFGCCLPRTPRPGPELSRSAAGGLAIRPVPRRPGALEPIGAAAIDRRLQGAARGRGLRPLVGG